VKFTTNEGKMMKKVALPPSTLFDAFRSFAPRAQ